MIGFDIVYKKKAEGFIIDKQKLIRRAGYSFLAFYTPLRPNSKQLVNKV